MPTLSNFWVRAIWGAVYVAVVVAALNWGFRGQLLLTTVFSSFCMFELLRMQGASSSLNNLFGLTLNLLVLAMHPLVPEFLGLVWTAGEFTSLLLAQVALLILVFWAIHLFRSGTNIFETTSPLIFGLVYISLPSLLFLRISDGVYSPRWPLLVFILTWSSDTFAYLVGRAMGKTKLYEALSPKKTVEGFAGGVLLTAAAGGLLGHIWEFGILSGLFLGALVSVAGTAGDLFESALKRHAGIKDSGRFLPGHGGALDRFDAFLFASVVVYSWYVFHSLSQVP